MIAIPIYLAVFLALPIVLAAVFGLFVFIALIRILIGDW